MKASIPLFLILLSLTGCFKGDRQVEQDWMDTCVYHVCVADPSFADATYIREKFGLRQITRDNIVQFAGIEETLDGVEGDWLVFQANTDLNGTSASKIMAYNFATNELKDVGLGPFYHQTRADLSKGRVVFSQNPLAGARDAGSGRQIILWDLATNEHKKIETGLEGRGSAFDFDGSWALIRNGGSPVPSENGLWAINVDTGKRVPLHMSLPQGALNAQGYSEFLQDEAVHGDFAYYSIALFKDARGNQGHNLTLYERNLATNATRILYEGKLGIGQIAVGDGFLTFGADLVTWSLDLTTLAVERITTPEEDSSGASDVAGDIITYPFKGEHLNEDSGIAVVNFRTRERIHIQTIPELHLFSATTDGKKLVLHGAALDPERFQELHYNLYWRPLEGLGVT